MRAAILAGGKGERFQNAAGDIPKVMAPLYGKPLLEYTIKWLKKYNINEIVLCTGYKKEIIEDYFGNGSKFGVRIFYSHEYEPKGTGGALKLAENFLKDSTFVLINGDCLIDVDLAKAVKLHKADNSILTINLTLARNPQHQELIEIEGNTAEEHVNIKNILQRGTTEHKEHLLKNKIALCNSGLFIVEPEIFNYLLNQGKFNLEPVLFPLLMKDNKKINGFYEEGVYIEIGNPDLYKRATEDKEVKRFLEGIGQ